MFLTIGNIDDILNLEQTNASEMPNYRRYTNEAWAFIFQHPESCAAIGIFENSQLVAWGSYRSNWQDCNLKAGVFEISAVVVDRTYQRRGIGARLLSDLVQRLRTKHSPQQIYLTVSPMNTGALMLYLSKGFVIFD